MYNRTTTRTGRRRIKVSLLRRHSSAYQITLILRPHRHRLLLSVIYRLLLRHRPNIPSRLIKRVVCDAPSLLIQLIKRRQLIRMLIMSVPPLYYNPHKRVRTVNSVSRNNLLKRMTAPSQNRRLLKRPSIRLQRAVRPLTHISNRSERQRLLVIIIKIHAARASRLIPKSTRLHLMTARVLNRRQLIRMIIPYYRKHIANMRSQHAGSLRHLIRNRSLLRMITRALRIARNNVALITIMCIFLSARTLRDRRAASAWRSLLLSAVLPITAMRYINSQAIMTQIRLILHIRRMRIRSSRLHRPRVNIRKRIIMQRISRWKITINILRADSKRIIRILIIMINGLLAIRQRALARMTQLVRRSCNTRISIKIKNFLRVITHRRARTAEMSLRRLISTVLRARMYRKKAAHIKNHARVLLRLLASNLRLHRSIFINGSRLNALRQRTHWRRRKVILSSNMRP